MAQQPAASVQNNFTAGLKTEFTGLNFPPNAWTDGDNTIPTLIGDVIRREGIDFEINSANTHIDRTNLAISTFRWIDAGGDGSTQVLVLQVGTILYFYKTSAATILAPMSTTRLSSTISMTSTSGANLATSECEYASGNGYLFVFNKFASPFYCTYSSGTIVANPIRIQFRDLSGIPDGLGNLTRPASLSDAHAYNINNQGWGAANIATFLTATGVYPANSDQWWAFKDSVGHFNPAVTFGDVVQANSPAPKGYFEYDVTNVDRGTVSGIGSLTNFSTAMQPRVGTWFQGRVFFAGIDDTNVNIYGAFNWSEKIYFSQIIVDDPTLLGNAFQRNDPTDETFFDLLPNDGGVIQIQGCGAIYKLFAIQNGLLVFAANGIWFITGSTGIGFTANDYVITKVSAVQSISSTSFIDVNGLPVFWNEEGIYQITVNSGSPSTLGMSRGGLSLDVEPITVGTILSFYANIPVSSKKFARGYYNPLDYTIQWTYLSTEATNVTSRYNFDSILGYNTANKAFYTYSIKGTPKIHGVVYIQSPGGSTAPDPVFKYIVSYPNAGSYNFTFADEHDTSYIDWKSYDNVGVNFESFFVTGYDLAGKAMTKFQPTYVHVYTRNPTAYEVQGIWDYASTGNSGKFSTPQIANNYSSQFTNLFRRHKIRGHGKILQLKFTSIDGLGFDIMGWAIPEMVNAGQ